jgi:acetyltransferase-like isoleucine patch superfamily enzyme
MLLLKSMLYIGKKIEFGKSSLMKVFLKLNGAKIGKNTFISFSARIYVNKLTIGNDVRILENVKIKGAQVEIGSNCIISSQSIILGNNNFKLGDKSYIGKKVHVDLNRDVIIGKDVGIGENTVIWTHGYFPPADKGYPVIYAPVIIKDNSWVSTNISILPGVIINENVIIGAGSIVTRSVDKDKIVAGNPAKIIKDVSDILSKRNFMEIMVDIFKSFFSDKAIIEFISENYVVFIKDKLRVHLLYKSNDEKIQLDYRFKNIVIFKDTENICINDRCKYFWIDFNKRNAKKSNDKQFVEILDFLIGYGIRLVYVY